MIKVLSKPCYLSMKTIVQNRTAKIFLIDDNAASRTTIRDLLEWEGYEILEPVENLELTRQIIESDPDLIVLDVMMPQMAGLDICKAVKQDPRTGHIPVIFMTFAEERKLRHHCNLAGGDDLLTKPIERLQLTSRVRSLIEQKRLYESIAQIEQVLFAIARAVENRYSSQPNSCVKLASLADGFSEYLNLEDSEQQNLRYAAYLHDIGTVTIPDDIMLKQGELTPQEKEIIEQHVLVGEEICQALPNKTQVLPIIRHHHERWNGTGYPDCLVGEEIPWLAQVFQILDIYVALTGNRAHKKTYSPQEALEILQEEAHQGWRNPQLVKQFVNYILQFPRFMNGS